MIDSVIFDMDGLMFDTERMWATFWEPALAALGLEYKEGLAEAERGTAGETSRNIVRQFYGEDCDANAIIDSLHRVADEEFQKPVPKKPGLDELLAWVDKYCEAVKPYITNTTAFLRDAQKAGKSILFEAQLGALRDLDYGIYPYTTSSNSVAAYAPVGSGLPTAKLDEVVGVVKAYSSCVGEGPFVCEMFGEEGQKLRDAGAEYGAKTGRPRRVGPIDLVATRYGVEVQGATNIALTKLDILSYMDKIPVCAHYELDGQQTDEFPFPVCLQDAKPVIEYVDGWKCDISKVRSWDELPENARNYVEYVERAIGCHIGYVSVGAERDSLIIR